MERLVPINEKIRGWEINFPDTLFFHKGKPKMMVKSDRDGYLISRKKARLNVNIFNKYRYVFLSQAYVEEQVA